MTLFSPLTAPAERTTDLSYEVNMKSNIDDFGLANLLISEIENCDVRSDKESEEKKEFITVSCFRMVFRSLRTFRKVVYCF